MGLYIPNINLPKNEKILTIVVKENASVTVIGADNTWSTAAVVVDDRLTSVTFCLPGQPAYVKTPKTHRTRDGKSGPMPMSFRDFPQFKDFYEAYAAGKLSTKNLAAKLCVSPPTARRLVRDYMQAHLPNAETPEHTADAGKELTSCQRQ